MVRKNLTGDPKAHSPFTRLSQCIFIITANIHFGYIAAIAFPAGPALVAKAPDIISFITKEIAIPWYINAVGTSSEIIFILIALHRAGGSNVKMVIHNIVPELATTAAQSIGPYICGRVH